MQVFDNVHVDSSDCFQGKFRKNLLAKEESFFKKQLFFFSKSKKNPFRYTYLFCARSNKNNIRKCNLRARNNKRRSIDELNPTNVLTPSKLQRGHLICNRITLKTSTWALLLLSRLLSGPH